MKTHINVTIDSELYVESKKRGLNLSQTINNYLKARFGEELKEVETKEEDFDSELLFAKTRVLELEKKVEERDRRIAKEKEAYEKRFIPFKDAGEI